MRPRRFRDEGLGVTLELDERFADVGFARDAELPTAHFIASVPGEGWIAALAIVTVRAEPLPAEEWLAGRLARARASFAEWSQEAHEMLVAPEAASLAGRPAIHVRYRLLAGVPPQDETPVPDGSSVPASLVEHWTLLVEERRWLLAMELMVQPPEWWDDERDALELPFRSLELL